MSETIWAPWRMEYILSNKTDECVFCAALAAGPDYYDENLILHVGSENFIIMNRYPYTHAHIMVLPKRHISRPEEMGKGERNELLRRASQYPCRDRDGPQVHCNASREPCPGR